MKTTFWTIYDFLKTTCGYTVEDVAEKLGAGITTDMVKGWMYRKYSTKHLVPSDIVDAFFANDLTLAKAFISYLKAKKYHLPNDIDLREECTIEEFEYFLALFLSDNKLSYSKSLQARYEAKTQLKTAKLSYDMRQTRVFASCGKEETIFDVQVDKDQLHLCVNFEKNRFRDEIPAYAGAYILQSSIVDISNASAFKFCARSEENIHKLYVEIKTNDRTRMHEIFPLNITSDFKEYFVKIEDFVFPYTAKTFNEITFVVKIDSFKNQDMLSGTLDIADLQLL